MCINCGPYWNNDHIPEPAPPLHRGTTLRARALRPRNDDPETCAYCTHDIGAHDNAVPACDHCACTRVLFAEPEQACDE